MYFTRRAVELFSAGSEGLRLTWRAFPLVPVVRRAQGRSKRPVQKSAGGTSM